MKKAKLTKRLLAFFLSLLTVLSSMAIPVFAAGMQEGDSSTVSAVWLTEFGKYETSSPSKYGEMQMFTLKKDNTPVYCMEYGKSFDGSSVTGKDLEDVSVWKQLSRAAQTGMIRASLYGYPNNTFGVGKRAAYAATQLVIWEYQVGYRTNPTSSNTQFTSYINRNSDVKKAYNALLEKIENHTVRCDFGTSLVELKGLGSGKAVTLTDKNGVLSQFTVTSPDSNIVVSQSGNKLTVYAKKAFNNTVTLTATKNETASGTNNALALVGAGQTLWYGTLKDPVQFTLRVKLSAGNIEIIKTSEDNQVGNVKFRITGDNYDETVTTGSNGKVKIENLMTGKYTVSEITADKYVAPAAQSITVNPGQTTTVSFSNILKKFHVTVQKQDSETISAQGDATLAGAVYGVYKDGVLQDTYTTDSNGSFTTNYYICGNDWTLQEITPSEGYELDGTEYSIGADPGDFTIELNTVQMDVKEAVKKGNVAIIKHMDDGSTQIETPETGAEFEIYLKSSGSYANAKESERDILITDENGYAASKDLPYGTYTVHQTKGHEGHELIPDFDVFISEDGKTYRYLINNAVFESLIEIVKVDAETGKTIPLSGTGFKVKDLSTGEFITQHINYPTPVDIDTFYTDTTGKLMLPETLTYGSYELYEVASPNGYVLNKEPVQFEVDGSQTTVTVTFKDMAQKGTITVSKQGEVFSSVSENGGLYQPVYSETGLEGAVFEIYADEDIITPDGTVRGEKDELVATITTGIDGTAISVPLYLGKYRMVEKTASYGFVLNTETVYFELVYAGQEIEITNISTTVKNERQKVQIDLRKVLEQDEMFGLGMNGEIQNVSFGLYAAADLTAADGSAIPADGLIEIASCTTDGTLTFTTDLPVGSEVYIREYSTDSHYLISDQKYPVKFEYAGQNTAVVHISVNDGEPIENKLIRGNVMGLKVDEEGFRIGGALFGLFVEDETEFTEENALMTCASNEIGVFLFENIPFGDYIVREIKPAPAFVPNDTNYFVSVSEQDQIIEIVIENQFLTGSVQVIKTDKDDNSKRLSGAVFEVYIDVDRNKEFDPEIDLLVGELNEFEAGVYRMDGLRYNGYFLHEKAAPDGYYGDDGYYYFEITKDQEVVTIENIADTGLFANEAIPQPPVEEHSPKTGAEDYLLPAVLLAAGSFSAILVLAFRKRKARSK